MPRSARFAVLSDTHLAPAGTPDRAWNNPMRLSASHDLLRAAVRTDDGSDPGRASLLPARTYRLTPGRAATFQDGMIHSIDYPEKSCFVRVTGANLDAIRRAMFDPEAGTVKQMTPQKAT